MGKIARRPHPTTRIEYIDGLRALAVLSVLVSHIVFHSPNLQSGPAYRLGMEGTHGVDLFFVLSGFCLAFPTCKNTGAASRTDSASATSP